MERPEGKDTEKGRTFNSETKRVETELKKETGIIGLKIKEEGRKEEKTDFVCKAEKSDICKDAAVVFVAEEAQAQKEENRPVCESEKAEKEKDTGLGFSAEEAEKEEDECSVYESEKEEKGDTILVFETEEVEKNETYFIYESDESEKEDEGYSFAAEEPKKIHETNFVSQAEGIQRNKVLFSHNHILMFQISNNKHPISVHMLHTISWPFGHVLRIVIFWGGESTLALVEFDSTEAAKRAVGGLDGRDIYPGCCTLRASFARTNRLKVSRNTFYSWDYTRPSAELLSRCKSNRRFPLLEDPLFLPYRPEKDSTFRPALLSEPFPPQRYSVKLTFEEFCN